MPASRHPLDQSVGTVYIISIDSEQLDILLAAMRRFPKTLEDEQELQDLLESLPDLEKAEPGVIHGLCY